MFQQIMSENKRLKIKIVEIQRSQNQQICNIEKDINELAQAKFATSKAALDEWQEVLHYVMPPTLEHSEIDLEDMRNTLRSGTGARLVKATLERAQQTHLVSINKKMEAEIKAHHMKNELLSVKCEWEIIKQRLADLEKLQNDQKSLLQTQKLRLLLVESERDRYRYQLDWYEKELIAIASSKSPSTNIVQMRINKLEEILNNYREMMNKIIKDNVNTADVEAPASLRDQLAHLNDQVETLTRDSDLLQTGNDHLERRLDCQATRDNSDLQEIGDTANNLQHLPEFGGTSNSNEIQTLTKELEDCKMQLQRAYEEHTSSSNEFREVCYLLFGYKIEKHGEQYKLTSMYADSPEEYLIFTISDGQMTMDDTNYPVLNEHDKLILNQYRFFPLFLGALTKHLYSQGNVILGDNL